MDQPSIARSSSESPAHALRAPAGVFVGLATLDLIQHVEQIPGPNAKASATWQGLSAGGPALNAAVTFAALGGAATLLTRIGTGPVADLIRADLERHRVRVVDLADGAYAPSVSAIAAETGSGCRQIVSTDAGRVNHPLERLPIEAERALEIAGIAVVDGHHPDIAALALTSLDAEPSAGHRPVVLDAGRWKPQVPRLLPHCTDVICSADFRLDGVLAGADLLRELLKGGARMAAISDGPHPIRWQLPDSATVHESAVPPVRSGNRSAAGKLAEPEPVGQHRGTLDTLGAGDVLHGAYAWARATEAGYTLDAVTTHRHLTFAATVAALSCEHRGTRSWLAELSDRGAELRRLSRGST